MNRQEIFDTVAKALIIQGKASIDPLSKRCLYRAPDGCKCAVGHLIPDDMYQDDMENRSVFRLSMDHILPDYFKNEGTFLYDLQQAHDVELKLGMSYWIIVMESIAEVYNLNDSVLDIIRKQN